MQRVTYGCENRGTQKQVVHMTGDEKVIVDHLIAQAVAEEREACARLADEIWEKDFGRQRGLERVGDYIRARGQ